MVRRTSLGAPLRRWCRFGQVVLGKVQFLSQGHHSCGTIGASGPCWNTLRSRRCAADTENASHIAAKFHPDPWRAILDGRRPAPDLLEVEVSDRAPHQLAHLLSATFIQRSVPWQWPGSLVAAGHGRHILGDVPLQRTRGTSRCSGGPGAACHQSKSDGPDENNNDEGCAGQEC